MPNRPYFKFWVGDWKKNSKLRGATPTEKSAWFECMLLLHDSDEYGILRWELTRLADAIPCHVGVLQSLVQQRILKGANRGETFAGLIHTDRKGIDHRLIETCDGPIWFSSRMVVDEHIRILQATGGVKGYHLKVVRKVHPEGGSQGGSGIEDGDGIREETGVQGEGKGSRRLRMLVKYPIPPPLDVPEFRAAWTDWQHYRADMKNPLSIFSVKAQLAQFQELGVERAVKMMRNTMFKGWQGLREEASEFNGKPIQRQQTERDARRDREYPENLSV